VSCASKFNFHLVVRVYVHVSVLSDAQELQTRLKDAQKSVEERDKKVADLQGALREVCFM
jgi:hypothetical protein